jgi:hypothetical protein
MKVTQKDVNIGDNFIVTEDLFVMEKPGAALDRHGYLLEGDRVTVTKRPRRYDEINCVEFECKGDVFYSYWIDFRKSTERV